MGCAQSSPFEDKEAAAASSRIDAQLKKERAAASRNIKMLLLGAGESGKSTILKQMKLIHARGFADDRSSYREIIFANTVQSMRAIVDAIPRLDPPLEPPLMSRNLHHVDLIQSLSLSVGSQLDYIPAELAVALRELWDDPAVRAAVERSREYQLNDSAVYYFESLDRLAQPDYLPTDQDILHSRVKTTGITEVQFPVGEFIYRIFDVGGQRSERKKWIHCFEDVTALVFTVSMSEYDQMLYEDETVNRMEEALTLFDSICNSRWFFKTTIILFLNKVDLFDSKILKSPMNVYFPDFEGAPGDIMAARTFIRDRFLSLNKGMSKVIHTHYTCATDTKQIKVVMAAVQDILMRNNLQGLGLM